MNFSIRSLVVAAIALASFAATAPKASAQYMAANSTTNHVLPYESVGTINSVYLPYAGTYLISGQQVLFVGGPNQETSVECWASPNANSTVPLTHGPSSASTVQTAGYITLPLNGYLTTGNPGTFWISCEYYAPSAATTVQTFQGTITATLVQ